MERSVFLYVCSYMYLPVGERGVLYECLYPSLNIFFNNPPIALSVFLPLCRLSHLFHLCVSFPLHTLCPFLFPSVSSLSAAQTPLIHSSVAADVNYVTGFTLSLTAAILSLSSYYKSLAVMHTITSHLHSLINTRVFAENKCVEL